jgi:glycosyltransferase involved in cell wall biosynthesis
MTENPLVSVIIPSFNSRLYIGDAIRSVLDQDYPKLEVIVVDDGSTDGTPDEARRFGERVLVLEQANAGPAAARNLGVAVAKGELIAFIDADDIWVPGKLTAQVEYLGDHPEVGVVFGRFLRWCARPDGSFGPLPELPATGTPCSIVSEASGWIYPEMLLDSLVWIVSAMVRRNIWVSLNGLDESLRTGEDYDFFVRASRMCPMHRLDRVVAYYRIHKESTTHVVRPQNNECIVLERALQLYGTAGPDGRAVSPVRLRRRLFGLHFTHGYQHYWHGSPRIARLAFRQALVSCPMASGKAWLYLLLATVKCLGKLRPPIW